VDLLPYDLAVGRIRRLHRRQALFHQKTHLPVEHQNYDPMVPYLAPYIEEAKFMYQEEQELLDYHNWDEMIGKDGKSGMGENMRFSGLMGM